MKRQALTNSLPAVGDVHSLSIEPDEEEISIRQYKYRPRLFPVDHIQYLNTST